jgi:alpha-beta hydrolase superfamily lysophospholipase
MIPAAAELDSRYRELTMPVAIMAGSDDEIVDVGRHSRRLHREIPGSELRIIDGAGHMVHHLAPREVVDLIRSVESRTGEATVSRHDALNGDHRSGDGRRASGSIQADL